MCIQSEAIFMNQARVQEQAGVQVQAMILDAAKEQAQALDKLFASAQINTIDPNLGQNVNICC